MQQHHGAARLARRAAGLYERFQLCAKRAGDRPGCLRRSGSTARRSPGLDLLAHPLTSTSRKQLVSRASQACQSSLVEFAGIQFVRRPGVPGREVRLTLALQ